MAVELAVGYVSVVPSARGFARKLSSEIAPHLRSAGGQAGRESSNEFASRFHTGVTAGARRASDSLGSTLTNGFRSTLSGLVSMARTASIGIGIGLGAAGGLGLKVAADFEQTTIAFEGLLGTSEKAQALLGDLREFAAKTPFEFPGLADASRRLLAVGFAAEDILPIMGTIGDVAAGLGVSQESIDGVIRAIGQIKGKGKVASQELLQISEQIPGFSAIGAIAESMGISVAEAFDLVESGAFGAEQGIQAILDGMANFPGAAGAMERQSKTLNGVISTFKDTLSTTAIDFITPYLPAISGAIADFGAGIQTFFTALQTGIRQEDGSRIEGIALGVRDAFRFVSTAAGAFADVVTERFLPAVGGLVSDGLESLSGWWSNNGDNVGNFFEDLGAIFSDTLAPALGTVGRLLKDDVLPAFMTLGDFIMEHQLIDEILFGMAAGMTAFAVASAAAAVSSFLALLPLYLLIAAIALLAAGLYFAYTNWGWFRDGVDEVVDLLTGETVFDALAGTLNTIADLISDIIGGLKAMKDLIPKIPSLPIPGGGFLGGLLGTVMGRESGGPVNRNQPYIVGEKRPELFVPSTAGTIIPEVPVASGGTGALIGALHVTQLPGEDSVTAAFREANRVKLLASY